MEQSYEPLISAILESYDTLGGINHLEGLNLPSKESICRIVDELETIVFPGYKDDYLVRLEKRETLRYTMGERITRIAQNLIVESEKSLRYMCKIRDQCERLGECKCEAEIRIRRILSKIPEIRQKINLDIQAAFSGDPAAKSLEEIILSYPGLVAVMIYRIAHEFWVEDIPLIPRMMTEYIHGRTGIDIHPGAKIGEHFFIDHGTGVVIGETTIIGNNVKIYHGVTLGARSVKKEEGNKKRHPTIEDDVVIYPGATILGGETVIGKGSIVGGNVWLLSSVPPYSKVYYQTENLILSHGTWDSPDYSI
jgi:serine O-acetyltransferase